MPKTFVLATTVFVFIACIVSAESIRGIDIEFVTIGNPGNAPDTCIMDDGTSGYGSVAYDYRIGKYEITNTQWNSFGGGSYFTGDYQPANRVSWYEAIQFCNYLTSGDRSQGVYLFSVTMKISVIFLELIARWLKRFMGQLSSYPPKTSGIKPHTTQVMDLHYTLMALIPAHQQVMPVMDKENHIQVLGMLAQVQKNKTEHMI